MKRIALTATAAVVVLLMFAVPANATHIQCGDTITADTTLDEDVICTEAPTSIAAICLGTPSTIDGYTLDLAGFAVRATGAAAAAGSTGVGTCVGGSDVFKLTIRNGTVEGFDHGVVLQGQGHAVLGLHITASNTGIYLIRNGPEFGLTSPCEAQADPSGEYCIVKNVIEVTRRAEADWGRGINVINSEGAHIWGNEISGQMTAAIHVDGPGHRVVFNKVQNCFVGGAPSVGIEAVNYGKTHVWGNTVSPCASGIGLLLVTGGVTPGGGARVRFNQVTGNAEGIHVADTAAVVTDNTASDNTGDGIHIDETPVGSLATPKLARNTANNNGGWGIFAPDAIDGGGNSATGNNGGGTGGNCTPNLAC